MPNSESASLATSNRIVITSICAASGAILYVLSKHGVGHINGALLMALFQCVSVFAIVCALSIHPNTWEKDVVFSLAIGAFTALLFYFAYGYSPNITDAADAVTYKNRYGQGGFLFFAALCVTFTLIASIPLVFYQAARDEGRLHFPYKQLFLHAWSNKLVLFVAVFFLAVSSLVLALWAGIFLLIGIRFFADLFTHSYFITIFVSSVFGLGVAIARERPNLIQSILNIILLLFRILAPVLGLVILLFLAFLPFVGLDKLLDTHITTRLLLIILFTFILFENAVIQGSASEGGFSRSTGWLVICTNLVLPVLAVISAYALSLRINQYGLTPDRVYLLLLNIIGGLYSFSYSASAALLRINWMHGIYKANPAIAILILLVSVVIHFPPLEPYALSARDQVERLRSGEISPEAFDFSYLKLKLGPVGRAAFDEIEQDQSLMKDPTIAARYKKAQSSTRYVRSRKRRTPIDDAKLKNVSEYMEIVPSSAVVSDDVIAIWMKANRRGLNRCKKSAEKSAKTCWVINADINKDDQPDFIWFNNSSRLVTTLRQQDGSWIRGPYLTAARGYKALANKKRLLEDLQTNGFQMVPHETNDLIIGDIRFR